MRITELLKRESIELDVAADSKEEAIDKLVSLMDAGGRLNDKAGYKEGILAREALGSTAIGEGIAIPHAKVEAVKEPGLAAMVVKEGVDYEAFDGSLAHLLFMIAAPAGGADVHLEALSRLSTLLMNPGFKENLIKAKDKDEFLKIIDEAEVARFGAPEGGETREDDRAFADLDRDGEADGGPAGDVVAPGKQGGNGRASGKQVKWQGIRRLPRACGHCLPYRHCPHLYGCREPGEHG